MRRLLVTMPLAVAFVLLPFHVEASPGDPRALRGTLAWSAGAGEPFVIVHGDDGRYYLADLSRAELRGNGPIDLGGRMSVLGVEGLRPYDISAIAVGQGDAAMTAPLPAANPSPAAPPAADEPSASPATSPPAQERAWRRVDGTVESVSGTTLQVRDENGRLVRVDTSRLSSRIDSVLQPGEDVTVYADSEGERGLIAVGFIQVDRSGPALPPRNR